MRFFLFPLIFQLGLMTVTGAGCGSNKMNELGYSSAPDFTLPTLADSSKTVQLSNISQKAPVLLAFWATWCPTCREEIPELNKYYDRYSSRGLQFLAVNVEEKADDLRLFQEKHLMKYPVLLDENGETADRYGLTGLPAVLVLAKGGKIVYYGYSIPENLDELIKGDLA